MSPSQNVNTRVEALENLYQSAVDGWTDDDARSLCTDITTVTGLRAHVIWDYFDDNAFGGDSEILLTEPGGVVYRLSDAAWSWITDPDIEREHSGALAHTRDAWLGERAIDVSEPDTGWVVNTGTNIAVQDRT